MDIVETAISLNNKGVFLLLAGKDQAAAEALTQALMYMKEQLYKTNSPDPLPSPYHDHCDAVLASTATTSSTNMSLEKSLITSTPLPNLEDEYYFIYNQALTVSPALPRSDVHLHLFSTCIILNLALGYHRRGLQGNRSCLCKAEKMYEMAAKLMGNETTNSENALQIKLAIVNNLAQIRYGQGNFGEARAGMNCLVSLIQRIGTGSSLLKEGEINGIMLNLLFLSPPEIAPAA